MKAFKILYYNDKSKVAKTAKVYPFSIIKTSIIDEYTYISYNCTINNSIIGKFCSIAKGVKIGLGKHPTDFMSTSPIFYSPTNPLEVVLSKELKFQENEQVIIGHDVWIGTNVTIADGVEIGNGAIIGANSVVTKNVKPYSIVGGIPAKEIKQRFNEELIDLIEESKWWDMPISFFKDQSVSDIFTKKIDINAVEILLVKIRSFNEEHNK